MDTKIWDNCKDFDIQGLYRAEHFAVKPLVEHANHQVYTSNPNCFAVYSLAAKYKEYIKSMKPSQFLFSCQACDYHFNTKEQFSEHV